MQTPDTIPAEVLSAYFGDQPVEVHQVFGGKVNYSFSATPNDGAPLLIQGLTAPVPDEKYAEYKSVSEHLAANNWEIPLLAQTKDGQDSFEDSSQMQWRAYQLLHNDEQDCEPDEVGAVLGKLHADLATLDYTPTSPPKVPSQDDVFKLLSDSQNDLPSAEAKEFAEKLIQYYKGLDPLPDEPKQLIHGDPKMSNFLFKYGSPYTLVDWEVLMINSAWFDIGDMIRAVARDSLRDKKKLDSFYIERVLIGYHAERDLGLSTREFVTQGLNAARVLTVMLAMRYLADYKDGPDGYFTWDSDSYSSRHAHNLERAQELDVVYQNLTSYLNSPPQIYVDFDNTLLDSKRFKAALFEMLSDETGIDRQTVTEDGQNSRSDERLGGYLFKNHIKKYDVDHREMWDKLKNLMNTQDFLFEGAAEFMESLRDAGFEPIILSFGEDEFQQAKIQAYADALFGGPIEHGAHFFVTQEEKNRFIAQNQVPAGGVLVDDIPGQKLPEGYTEIHLNFSGSDPMPASDNFVEVSSYEDALESILKLFKQD